MSLQQDGSPAPNCHCSTAVSPCPTHPWSCHGLPERGSAQPSAAPAQPSSAQPTCPLVPGSFPHPAALHTLCFQCRTRSGAQMNSQVLNGCLEIMLLTYADDSLLLLSLLLLFNVIFASGSTSPTPSPSMAGCWPCTLSPFGLYAGPAHSCSRIPQLQQREHQALPR